MLFFFYKIVLVHFNYYILIFVLLSILKSKKLIFHLCNVWSIFFSLKFSKLYGITSNKTKILNCEKLKRHWCNHWNLHFFSAICLLFICSLFAYSYTLTLESHKLVYLCIYESMLLLMPLLLLLLCRLSNHLTFFLFVVPFAHAFQAIYLQILIIFNHIELKFPWE